MKTLTILCLALICCGALAQEEPFWEEMPAPATGAATAMEIDNLGNLYIGSLNGLWRSSNHGDNWEQIFNGEYHISREGMSVEKIAVNKNNEIAVLGVINNSLHELFISSDFGDSWTEWEGPVKNFYAGTRDMAWNQNNCLYILLGNDVYYSNSPDSNWTACETKLNVVSPRCMDIFNDSCIAVTGRRRNPDYEEFLFLSEDKGKSWKEIELQCKFAKCIEYFSRDEVFVGTENGLLLYEKDIGITKISPESICVSNFHIPDRGEIYIGVEDHLLITRDSGKTWTISYSVMDEFAARMTKSFSYQIVSEAKKDSFGNLYARTQCWGIYRSTDSGESWRPCNNGFFSARINRIAFDKDNNIYIATWGLFKSTDRGKSWKTVPGFEGFEFKEVFFSSKNYIYASACYADSLYRSTDGGKTWEGITEGLGYSGGNAQDLCQIVENKDGYLFATSCGFGSIKRSFDDGKSWEKKSPPADISGASGEYIAINSEGHLFTSCEDGILLRTTDNFDTWEQVVERDMMCFSEHEIIFYPNSGIGFAGYSNCLYNTKDNGRTWDEVEYKYPPFTGYYHPKAIDSLKNLYWLGYAPAVILRSDSLYQHFDTVSSGFNYLYFHTMAVCPVGYIWVATDWGGLHRSRERFVPVEEQPGPASGTALEVRPNPCTESTVIHYALTTPGTVRLSLYNLLGMKAASWNQGLQPPGAHTLTIDTSHLPPGAYLLRLEAGSHRQSVMVVRE